MQTLSRLDRALLRTIDGRPAQIMTFDDRCRLATLTRYGVRVTTDDHGSLAVHWSSVHDAKRYRR